MVTSWYALSVLLLVGSALVVSWAHLVGTAVGGCVNHRPILGSCWAPGLAMGIGLFVGILVPSGNGEPSHRWLG